MEEIINQIEHKASFLLNNEASLKEIFLYHFLNEEISDITLLEGATKVDKICYAAFFSFDEDLSNDIEKLQNSSPVRGMHYTNNLIELIAMAKHDFEREKLNLNKYLITAPLNETFIIHKIFGNITLEGKKISAVDDLIKKIFLECIYKDVGRYFLKALESTSELNDLYIIRQCLGKTWSLHPDRVIEKDLNKVLLLHRSLQENYKYKAQFFLIFLGLLLGGVVIFFFNHFWDIYNLEPKITAITIIFPFIAVIFLREKILSPIRNYYKVLIEKMVNYRYFSVTGIPKNEIDKIKEKYQK